MSRRAGFLALALTWLPLLAIAPAALAADASTSKPSPWDRMRFFLGSWVGEGHGEPGSSSVEREYRFILGDRFIQTRNVSTYAPQEKNPKGEVHEDLGLFSWDRGRRRIVLRQFHVEGFVNQYVADSAGAATDSLLLTSEAIENIPPGFRARETYRILGLDEFVERFEMAEPGRGFTLYSETGFRRKK